jgi:hypothetical protein
MRQEWHVTHIGNRRAAYSVLVGKPEGKRPLGRPRLILKVKVRRYKPKRLRGVPGD